MQATRPMHAQGARNLHPDLARDAHPQHFGGTYAEHVTTKGTARGGMGVTAHTEHAGLQMTPLGQHHMTNALAVDDMRQFPLSGRIAGDLHDLLRIGILRRNIVVQHQNHFVGIPNLRTQLLEHRLQTPRARRVVEHGQVHLAGQHFANSHMAAPGSACDELLSQSLRPLIGQPLCLRDVRIHSGLAPAY
jgi:hypothetical protein